MGRAHAMETPLDPEIFGPNSPCFGCSPRHPIGFQLKFAIDGEDVITRFTPDARYEGPPGVMHGGLVLTLADELAAWTVIGKKERFGFTAAVNARLSRPVRTNVEVIGRGRMTADRGRICQIAITLIQRGETTFAGDFTFALLDEAAAEKLLEGPLPEAWKRFARSRQPASQ
jgi:acyl-coenzyme A thioesterase PaaI-like protein